MEEEGRSKYPCIIVDQEGYSNSILKPLMRVSNVSMLCTFM